MADLLNPIPAGPPTAAPGVGPGVPAVRAAASAPPAQGAAPAPAANADQVTVASELARKAAPPAGKDEAGAGKDMGTLERAESSLKAFLKTVPTNLQFTRDEAAGRIVFKVVNPVTKEVIRQVPSEEVLAMARRLRQLEQPGKASPGILLDQQG